VAEDGLNDIPLIPDKVADKLQAGKDVAIEELVSESSLQAQREESLRKAEPVHAGALTPISKQDAARRTRFDGKTLPRLPATRRVLPEPFRRHVINLSLPWEDKKTWQYVRADQVQAGDIVPDLGLVQSISVTVRREPLDPTLHGWTDVAVGTDVTIQGPERYHTVDASAQVRVFRVEARNERSTDEQAGQELQPGDAAGGPRLR
jgi:hypothetical protein